VYDQLLSKLQAQGGYLVNAEEKIKLQAVIWQDGHINANIVAQSADKMAAMAGFSLPEEKCFFIVPEQGTGADYPFSGEKMSVTMAFYQAADIDEAIALTNRIQAYQGQGHSCGIYSYNDDNILQFGLQTKTSRVMVNQPQAASNSGNLWNGMRQTFSLGCGSWGGNGTNNNITWQDLINVTWISKPLETIKELPSDEELFGNVMNKF
jgi:sulfoacetaldehyde dehydrogenase